MTSRTRPVAVGHRGFLNNTIRLLQPLTVDPANFSFGDKGTVSADTRMAAVLTSRSFEPMPRVCEIDLFC